jgi:hypothetical protein
LYWLFRESWKNALALSRVKEKREGEKYLTFLLENAVKS